MRSRLRQITFPLALLIVAGWAFPVLACPFCDPVAQTFAERISKADVALIGSLVSVRDEEPIAAVEGSVRKAVFRVDRILKGGPLLEDAEEISATYYGNAKPGAKFLLVATSEGELLWSVPERLSPRGVEYIVSSRDLPEQGPERLAFFLNYLEDDEKMLDRDAYTEFAVAPYDVVAAMKDGLPHDRIAEWVRDPEVENNRRRLYLVLLGVCGGEDDLPLLEELLESRAGKSPSGLDAVVACYLKLKGPDGLPLIEDRFLKNREAKYEDTYAAVEALRFIVEQTDAVPRARAAEALYHILDRHDLADLVIRDLARWEDWKVMDRLVQMFHDADEDSSWVRQPIARYLMACPLPEAKQHLQELKQVDPEAVAGAGSVLALLAGRGRGAKNAIPGRQGVAGEPGASGASDEAPTPAGRDAGSPEAPAGGDSGPIDRNGRSDPSAGAELPTPPSFLAVLGIPFMAGLVLLALMWFVLAGVGGRTVR